MQTSDYLIPFINNSNGKELCELTDLKDLVYDLTNFFVNKTLIYKVICSFIKNQKLVRHAHYKCNAGISGSNRKLRPQKGTGKSRISTNKVIGKRGGAAKFGFSGDNYKDLGKRYRKYNHINKKEKKSVTFAVIADRIRNNSVYCYHCDGENSNIKSFISNEVNNNELNKKYKYVFIYVDEKMKYFLSNRFFIEKMKFNNLDLLKLVKSDKLICDFNALKHISECFKKFKQIV